MVATYTPNYFVMSERDNLHHLPSPLDNDFSVLCGSPFSAVDDQLPANHARILETTFGGCGYAQQELPIQQPMSDVEGNSSKITSPLSFSSPVPMNSSTARCPNQLYPLMRQPLPSLGGQRASAGPLAVHENDRVYAVGAAINDERFFVSFGVFDDRVTHIQHPHELQVPEEVVDIVWMTSTSLLVATVTSLHVVTYNYTDNTAAIVTSEEVHTGFIREIAYQKSTGMVLSGGHDQHVVVTQVINNEFREVFRHDCGAVVGSVRWMTPLSVSEFSATVDMGDIVLFDISNSASPIVSSISTGRPVYTHQWLSTSVAIVGHVSRGGQGEVMSLVHRTTQSITPISCESLNMQMVHDVHLINTGILSSMSFLVAYGTPTVILTFSSDPDGNIANISPVSVTPGITQAVQLRGALLTNKDPNVRNDMKLVSVDSEGSISVYGLTDEHLRTVNLR